MSDKIDIMFKEVHEHFERLKKFYAAECKKGNYGLHLNFIGFSGGYINYKCTNCNVIVRQLDKPTTI